VNPKKGSGGKRGPLRKGSGRVNCLGEKRGGDVERGIEESYIHRGKGEKTHTQIVSKAKEKGKIYQTEKLSVPKRSRETI